MSSSLSGRVTDGRALTKRRRRSPPPPPHNGVLSFIVRRRGRTNYGNRDRGYPGAPRQISPPLPPPSLTTITIAVDGAFKKINKTVAIRRTKGRRCAPPFSRTVSSTPSPLLNGGNTRVPAPVSNGRDVRKRYGIRRDNSGTRRGRNNIEPSLNRPGLIIIIVAPSRESAGNGVFTKGVLFGYPFSTLSSVPLLPRTIGRTCPSPAGARGSVRPCPSDFYTFFFLRIECFRTTLRVRCFRVPPILFSLTRNRPGENTKMSCWAATPVTDLTAP